MHFLQAINSDIPVFTVCNKTGGTINADIKNCTSYFSSKIFRVSTAKLSLWFVCFSEQAILSLNAVNMLILVVEIW